MPTETDTNERGCYCDLWEQDSAHLEQQGVPRGFCGLCATCGEPGHTRHHPGAVPFTDSWCDYHYKLTQWTHPAAIPGRLIWLTLTGIIVFLFWK